MQENYYQPHAYNSQTAKPLDANYSLPDNRMLWLPMGNAQQRVPLKLFIQYQPRHMRAYAKKEYRPDWLLNTERYGAMNEHCIRPISFSKVGAVVLQMELIGKGMGIFLTIIAVVTILLLSSIYDFEDTLYCAYIISIAPLFFLGLWLLSKIIYVLFPIKHGIGSLWEINRQTGMVSQFIYNKRKPKEPPKILSAPFAEMDAFLLPVLGRFGYTYLFYLHHRYSNLSIRVGDMLGSVTDMNRCEELWDFIQNYMDISQPLPDIPLFEDYRTKDPVTAQYDQQTGRSPHYWLEMSDQAWKEQLNNNPLITNSSQ